MSDQPTPTGSGTGSGTGTDGGSGTGKAGAGATEDIAGAPAPARRPTPSGQAASRARRIGGRPAPGRRPTPAGSSAAVSATPSSTRKGTAQAAAVTASAVTAAPATKAAAKAAPATKAATKAAPATKATKTATSAKSAPDTGAQDEPTARRGGMRAARAAATERAQDTKPPTTGAGKRPPRPSTSGPEAGSAAEAQALRRRLDRLRWIPATVLAAVVVVLTVLCVALGHGVWWATKSASEVRGEVLAAAKTCTAKVSAYDYRSLAQSQKEGLACATGKFKADYKTALSTIIAKEAPKTKTTQSMQVANAGIEQVSDDGKQWTLLIYGQHTVTNVTTGTKAPRLDKLSVRVVMDRVNGKWLISKLDLVS